MGKAEVFSFPGLNAFSSSTF